MKEWERGLVEFGDIPMLEMFQDITGVVNVKSLLFEAVPSVERRFCQDQQGKSTTNSIDCRCVIVMLSIALALCD